MSSVSPSAAKKSGGDLLLVFLFFLLAFAAIGTGVTIKQIGIVARLVCTVLGVVFFLLALHYAGLSVF